MRTYGGAVFFDVDGTLIDTTCGIEEISPRTREALGILREKGYLTCVTSGRSRGYLPDLGEFGGYITSNGAAAEVEGELLFQKTAEPSALLALVDYLRRQGWGYIIESGTRCYGTRTGCRAYLEMADKFFRYCCFHPMEELADLPRFPARKLQIACDTQADFDRVRARFGKAFVFTAHKDKLAADIAPAGVTKASGILETLVRLGIPREETYAFGDDHNDLEMLKTVAHGVAMTPHVPGLETAAELVTGSVAEDGVYHGLARLGLL